MTAVIAPPAPPAPCRSLGGSLLAEVRRHGGFDAGCLNCGGCSVVCDLASGAATFPRRPIHRVVVGLREDALEGLEPWLCHDCGDCSLACPRSADPAESMRTLRRWLTGQYDGTGLASRVLGSRAWHVGALATAAALVLGLLLLYHLYWGELALADFATTPMDMGHMFPRIVYFAWIVYALPLLFLLVHAWRLAGFALAGSRPRPRHFLAEGKTLLGNVVAQREMRRCPSEARGTPVVGWWLYAGSAEVVPRRWLKHWLMASGTIVMVVLTAFFLEWFQTDAVRPFWHPQRSLGYLATACILWGTTDILVRRALRPRGSALRRRGRLMLPLLLWATAASGIAIHVLRLQGQELAALYAYAVHLLICVPLIVVEVPFGDWAHMIDRPLALYLHAVRERALREPAAAAIPETSKP